MVPKEDEKWPGSPPLTPAAAVMATQSQLLPFHLKRLSGGCLYVYVCVHGFFCIFKVESQHFLAPGIVYIDLLMVFVTLIPVSIFSATIYPQHLEQCLEHSMCSINIS